MNSRPSSGTSRQHLTTGCHKSTKMAQRVFPKIGKMQFSEKHFSEHMFPKNCGLVKLTKTLLIAVAYCHSNWLGIGGSWVRIQTLQATLDAGLPQKYKKRFPVRKSVFMTFDSLDATYTKKLSYSIYSVSPFRSKIWKLTQYWKQNWVKLSEAGMSNTKAYRFALKKINFVNIKDQPEKCPLFVPFFLLKKDTAKLLNELRHITRKKYNFMR